jgi:hypothetical protein
MVTIEPEAMPLPSEGMQMYWLSVFAWYLGINAVI